MIHLWLSVCVSDCRDMKILVTHKHTRLSLSICAIYRSWQAITLRRLPFRSSWAVSPYMTTLLVLNMLPEILPVPYRVGFGFMSTASEFLLTNRWMDGWLHPWFKGLRRNPLSALIEERWEIGRRENVYTHGMDLSIFLPFCILAGFVWVKLVGR